MNRFAHFCHICTRAAIKCTYSRACRQDIKPGALIRRTHTVLTFKPPTTRLAPLPVLVLLSSDSLLSDVLTSSALSLTPPSPAHPLVRIVALKVALRGEPEPQKKNNNPHARTQIRTFSQSFAFASCQKKSLTHQMERSMCMIYFTYSIERRSPSELFRQGRSFLRNNLVLSTFLSH